LLRSILNRLNGLRSDAESLPGLLIIGAQKAGTSALYSYLTHHPEVVKSKKELKFFNRNYSKGKLYYKRQFPLRKGLRIDATPSYLYSKLVPARAAASLSSSTRIIVLLRDPVARAYSAWNMYQRISSNPIVANNFKNIEQEDSTLQLYSHYCSNAFPTFPEAIHKEMEWIKAGTDIREPSLLRRGFYVEQIKYWQQHFPAENFFFIHNEDLKVEAKAREILSRLEPFLGLRSGGLDSLPYAHIHVRAYTNPLPTELRPELTALFNANNRGLQELTGLDLPWAPL
jgi:hypothetical protein